MRKVLTVGVYDMMHIGHIILFERAKALGDYLIVAVQDDKTIKKYKPDVQMVYNTQERCYMVNSVKFVDEVILYQDVDIDITQIEFDVFAKGGDQNHPGFQRAIQWCYDHGKEVINLPRTEGISSSLLRTYRKI